MRTLPDVIRTLDLPGGGVDIDEADYLVDPADWSPAFAQWVAANEGIALTGAHWGVFAFMRDWLDEHGVAPDARYTLGYLRNGEGLDKAGAKARLFDLFPKGYVQQACKMAGMRQPRAWSTG